MEWRRLPWPSYHATEAGEILWRGRPLRQTPNFRGYPRVRIMGTWRRVCCLVLEAFSGPRPSPVHQCAHDDNNRGNSAAANLTWKTPKENAADKRRHGTQTAGAGHHAAKLDDDQAAELRGLKGTMGTRAAGARYGICHQQVSRIWRGLSHRSAKGA